MARLESYMLHSESTVMQFMCDPDGHPEQPGLRGALEEFPFFSRRTRVGGRHDDSDLPKLRRLPLPA